MEDAFSPTLWIRQSQNDKKKSPTLFKFFTQLFITRIVPTTLTKSYRVSLFIFAQNQVSQKYLRMISFEHANLFPVLNRAAIENSKIIQMSRKKNNFESNWTIISNLDASKTKLGKPINSSSSEKGGQPNKKMSAKWKGICYISWGNISFWSNKNLLVNLECNFMGNKKISRQIWLHG